MSSGRSRAGGIKNKKGYSRVEILLQYDIFPFLLALTALVFIHELGHYLVARWNGVRVETFSIGFGPKLFGWVSKKSGTHWIVSAIPLGGYVKMFGDTNPASVDIGERPSLTAEQEKEAFYAKRVAQRSAIVAAGPAANFLLAIALMAGTFVTVGKAIAPSSVGQVLPDSAAARAGLLPGDKILSIDGKNVATFSDLQRKIVNSPGVPLQVVLERNGLSQNIVLTPAVKEVTDNFGKLHRSGLLGVQSVKPEIHKFSLIGGVQEAAKTCWLVTGDTLRGLWDIVTGVRSFKEMGGPVKIAQISGEVADTRRLPDFLFFLAVLSLNIGMVNLFPIPALDGGHLLFYFFEALRGKPVPPKVQAVGSMAGFGMILVLIACITWNDITPYVKPLLERFF
jgi:regulator of sigma E protease